MRIAIVTDFYLDYIGGAQSSIHEQRSALAAAGHTVFLVSTARLPRRDGFRMSRNGLEVRPSWTLPGFTLPVVSARGKLIDTLTSYFDAHRIEVVHLQTEFGLANAAATAARRLGIAVVHTIHTFYWQSAGAWQAPLTPLIRYCLERVTGANIPRLRFVGRPSDDLVRNLTLAMARRSDVVVSPSAHQAADLRATGLLQPVEVIPNTIARSPRHPALLTAEHTARPRLLWVARCEREKRPLVFADAAIAALDRTNNAFEVDFVGEGSQLAELRRRVAGRPGIHVHGALEHESVLELMDAASLVCLTSFGFDNQPMTIVEAVSRYRGILYCDPKLREGLSHSGHLAARPDASGIADAIVTLATDRDALVRLSAGAERDAELFSAETYVQRIIDVYEQARNTRVPVS